MNPTSPSSGRERTLGLLLAVMGIATHQLVAPFFTRAGPWITRFGEFLTFAGLAVILLGIQRRIAREVCAAEKTTPSSRSST